ncbi:MAG TPA: hypothetical protein VGN63_13770 [Flavisolibacter sp.]|nr:hypothetical protein [Flavisolibacter sp.]
MKKVFLLAALAVSIAASAQTKKKVPPPPPPVEALNDIPPPPSPKPPLPPPPPALPKDYTDFLSRNSSVKSLHWQNEILVIKKKNGQTERYVLNEQGIREAEAKYGKLPQAPPPPPKPPVPPTPPHAPDPDGEWQ